MSTGVKAWLTNPCPNCGAGAGEKCAFDKVSKHMDVCYERTQIYIPKSAVQNILTFMTTAKKAVGPNVSHRCARGDHAPRCSGVLRRNHGLSGVCACPCHKLKKPEPETDPDL